MIVFETDRLLLRNFIASDLTDLFHVMKNSESSALGGWKNLETQEESQMLLEKYVQEDETFAIQLKDIPKVIGFVKLTINNNKGTNIARSVSYILAEEYWGSGYMTEAVTRIIRYVFEQLKIDMLTAWHYPENIASKRILEKCGFE